MADKLMYIPNVDTQNYTFFTLQVCGFKRLGTQLNESNNKNSIKVPKVVGPTMK